jgi:hypothetical protein
MHISDLRPLRPTDLEAAHALSTELQWPHRLEDWQFALQHGRGVAAACDGKLVGTALGWLWGTDRATLGLVMVAPAMQGQRIGQRLMCALLDHIGQRHLLLHATTEGVPLYERLGFRRVGEVRQHQGMAVQAPLPPLASGERLRALGVDEADALIALDVKASGLPRRPVLRQLLQDDQVVVFERDAKAVGFSVLRRFGRGHVIGPVVAPDMASARALIAHWCKLYAGRFLRIDVDAERACPSGWTASAWRVSGRSSPWCAASCRRAGSAAADGR